MRENREKRGRECCMKTKRKMMTVSTMVMIKTERLTETKKERQKKKERKDTTILTIKSFFREREGDMEKKRENKYNM